LDLHLYFAYQHIFMSVAFLGFFNYS